MKNLIVIIRGAAASGKTTIARRISKRFVKSFHIDVDTIRHFDPKAKLTPEEFILASKAAATLSNTYFSKGYTVIIDSTFIKAEYLDALLKNLRGRPLFLFTLKPNLKELLGRDMSRAKFRRLGDRIKVLHSAMERSDESRGFFLNNSGQTSKDTTGLILDKIRDGIGKIR